MNILFINNLYLLFKVVPGAVQTDSGPDTLVAAVHILHAWVT